jgi:hypothetical protein
MAALSITAMRGFGCKAARMWSRKTMTSSRTVSCLSQGLAGLQSVVLYVVRAAAF